MANLDIILNIPIGADRLIANTIYANRRKCDLTRYMLNTFVASRPILFTRFGTLDWILYNLKFEIMWDVNIVKVFSVAASYILGRSIVLVSMTNGAKWDFCQFSSKVYFYFFDFSAIHAHVQTCNGRLIKDV